MRIRTRRRAPTTALRQRSPVAPGGGVRAAAAARTRHPDHLREVIDTDDDDEKAVVARLRDASKWRPDRRKNPRQQSGQRLHRPRVVSVPVSSTTVRQVNATESTQRHPRDEARKGADSDRARRSNGEIDDGHQRSARRMPKPAGCGTTRRSHSATERGRGNHPVGGIRRDDTTRRDAHRAESPQGAPTAASSASDAETTPSPSEAAGRKQNKAPGDRRPLGCRRTVDHQQRHRAETEHDGRDESGCDALSTTRSSSSGQRVVLIHATGSERHRLNSSLVRSFRFSACRGPRVIPGTEAYSEAQKPIADHQEPMHGYGVFPDSKPMAPGSQPLPKPAFASTSPPTGPLTIAT